MITQCLCSNDPNCLLSLSAGPHWIPWLPRKWDNTRTHYSRTARSRSCRPVRQRVRGVTRAPGLAKQTHVGVKRSERKSEMDVQCIKFIAGEGDLQRWPRVSAEALVARVVIVHWDNTLTPRRALGLECNVPAELQHIREAAVGRIQWWGVQCSLQRWALLMYTFRLFGRSMRLLVLECMYCMCEGLLVVCGCGWNWRPRLAPVSTIGYKIKRDLRQLEPVFFTNVYRRAYLCSLSVCLNMNARAHQPVHAHACTPLHACMPLWSPHYKVD